MTTNNPLTIYREVAADFSIITLNTFITEYIPYTVRDESVNREGVWDTLRRKGYLSYCMVGYGSKTAIHLVNLEMLYDMLIHDPAKRDPVFADFIKGFINNGFKYAHLDGGNRCDTFEAAFNIKTDLGEVKISKGDYRFQPSGEDDYQLMVAVDKDMTLEDVNNTHPELYKKLMNSSIHIWVYTDLDQEERGNFFRILNANVTLNAMELRNPTVSAVAMGIRNTLNKKYKSLFIEAGILTETDAARFGFKEWVLKMGYSYTLGRAGSLTPYLGAKKDLDKEFKSNSKLDNTYPTFEKFFESVLVPYVKVMKDKKELLFKKNAWYDFGYVLTYMQANNMKIPNVNSEGRYALINAYNEWLVKRCSDKKTVYKKVKNTLQGYFNDLFSKNANNVFKIRTMEIRDLFIPDVIDRGIIVTLDDDASFNDQQKAEMYINDNVTSDGTVISAGKLKGGEIHGDHVNPRSKGIESGGTTSVDNGKLETAEYNRQKSDKIIETPLQSNGQ